MTAIAPEASTDEAEQPIRLSSVLRGGFKLIAVFVRWHPWSFGLAVAGAALFVSAILASALVVGRITDLVIIPVLDGGEPVENKAVLAAAAVLGVALWKAAGITLRRTAAGYLQYATRADARRKLIDHQMRLELSWYDRRSTGDLLSVSEVDTQQSTFVLAPLPYATGAALLLVGTIVMVAVSDLLLGLITLAGLSLIVVIDVRGAFRMFSAFEEVQVERGYVGEIAHESFDGALTVKALGREDEETARFRRSSDRLRDKLISVNTTFATYRSVVESLPAAITVVVLVLGATKVASGDVTAGGLVSIAYLITLMAFPLQLLGFVSKSASADDDKPGPARAVGRLQHDQRSWTVFELNSE